MDIHEARQATMCFPPVNPDHDQQFLCLQAMLEDVQDKILVTRIGLKPTILDIPFHTCKVWKGTLFGAWSKETLVLQAWHFQGQWTMRRNQKMLQEVVCWAGDLREIFCLCPTLSALQPFLQSLPWSTEVASRASSNVEQCQITLICVNLQAGRKDVKSFVWNFCTLCQELPLSQACIAAVWWLFWNSSISHFKIFDLPYSTLSYLSWTFLNESNLHDCSSFLETSQGSLTENHQDQFPGCYNRTWECRHQTVALGQGQAACCITIGLQ